MCPRGDRNVEPGSREGLRRRLLLAAVPAFLLLAPGSAWAADGVPQDQFLVLAAVMAGALALAIAAGLWALAEQRTASKLRRALRVSGSKTRAAVGERDALLSAGSEALIVWSRENEAPITYGAAQAMLDSCLKGLDGAALSKTLDELTDRG